MPIREVRSPNSLTSDQHHPRRGEIRQGGIYGDGGHVARSPGKGPAVRRPDGNEPVQGGPQPQPDPE
jgi:hypothetical protein